MSCQGDGYVTTVMAPVEAATSIEIGDLVWLDVDRTYPAAEFVARYRRRNGRVHSAAGTDGRLLREVPRRGPVR